MICLLLKAIEAVSNHNVIVVVVVVVVVVVILMQNTALNYNKDYDIKLHIGQVRISRRSYSTKMNKTLLDKYLIPLK